MYLNPKNAAAFLDMSTSRLRTLQREGVLIEGVHYFQPPGLRPRFSKAALSEWLESSGKPAPAENFTDVLRELKSK